MEVKVCKMCKKMFQYITGPEICPRCKQQEEEWFQQVKEYLRENPGATLVQVNKETGVSASLIEKFLRQGRLEVSADSPIALTCERCGKKIITGRYCKECSHNISNELHQVKKDLLTAQQTDNKFGAKTGAKMRFLDNDHIRHN